MRATERMALLDKIGIELQRLYTFTDIDAFFSAMGINVDAYAYGGSKRIYAKEVLSDKSETDVLMVAAELGLVPHGGTSAVFDPPQNWVETPNLKLFISHLSAEKMTAKRLKETLAAYAIAGFVAHEDIHPTLAWQDEIERALNTMDAFLAVHHKGFSASMWCQQEVGFALGRNAKIISFKMDEDPTGFIGKHQALSRQNRTAEAIAAEINRLLLADPRTAERLRSAQEHLPHDTDVEL